MAINLVFRGQQVRTLTNSIGCYVLCDLDGVPIYVGHRRNPRQGQTPSHVSAV